MQLNTFSIPASVKKAGQGRYIVTPEQSFKIESSPQGEDILEVSPPAGKQWAITVRVNIEESDA